MSRPGWRREAGQLSWFAREQHRPEVLAKRWKAFRGLRLPRLPRWPTQPGSVWAVTMVRDEADIIASTLNHLFAQGVDQVIVADNLSTDGTSEVLADIARREPRLHLATDAERAYFQSEKMSRLVHAAWKGGADWIIPFDADEFWFAENGSLAEFFAGLTRTNPDAGVVEARFHHMVPTTANPDDLVAAEFVLDATPVKPGKVALRAHRLATVSVGNHGASRVGERLEGLHIAHAVYRGPAQVARKVRQGASAVALTRPGAEIAKHWRAGSSLDDAAVAEVWANISNGRPDDRLNYRAFGPMLRLRPLTWTTWDPDHQVPRDIAPRVFQ